MAWPVSPANGQTTTINGVTYVYNSVKNAWSPATIASVSTITYSGNVSANNVNATTSVTANGQPLINLTTMLTYQLAL